jgi:hypothetical protein
LIRPSSTTPSTPSTSLLTPTCDDLRLQLRKALISDWPALILCAWSTLQYNYIGWVFRTSDRIIHSRRLVGPSRMKNVNIRYEYRL